MVTFAQQIKPLLGLLIFGNIENLVLACQGVSYAVNPIVLGILSLVAVIIWLLIGTYGTKVAIKYADIISFAGGFAIFVLGIYSMLPVILTIFG